MRLSELTGLKLADIEIPKKITKDPDNTGLVRIRRKGGKIEGIALNYKACQAIATYLKFHPSVETDGLFVSNLKRPLSKRRIQHAIAGYLKEAGIIDASVHAMRHTMATHHIARGTDIKTVQETLGHASLNTTTIYVSMAKKTQRQALQEHAL
jgi:integrase/recombinase XerC